MRRSSFSGFVAGIGVVGALGAAPRAARAQGQEIDACIAASEQALVSKKAGKLLDERKALSRCAASSCPDPVQTSCRDRLAGVTLAIPSIVFAARDRTGRDLLDVALDIDGIPYAQHLDGSAIALDPGEHEFRFGVAGADPVVERLVLREGEQERHETIVLDTAPPDDGATQRALALGVGGVGVAGWVAGAVFGALSLAAHNAYEHDCGRSIGAPAGECNAQGVSGESDAATKGTIATASFVGGGVLAAAGAVWYFLAPRGKKGMEVRVGSGGIAVEGAF